MADVEMKEAAGSSKGKAVAKSDAGDKKKFEVKKVPTNQPWKKQLESPD
jgi:hypothetical protein